MAPTSKEAAQNFANEYNQVVALTTEGSYFEQKEFLENVQGNLTCLEWIYPETIVGYICYINAESHFLTYPTKEVAQSKSQLFWCKECYLPCDKSVLVGNDGVVVYRVNIGIYSQVCDSCGKLVVDGVKMAKDNTTPLCLFGRTT